MQFKDYYATLGVAATATNEEIKNAYRRLARKYHPDVSKEFGAEEKIKTVNEAYEVLRDPQKRAAFDQLRSQGYKNGDSINKNKFNNDFDFEQTYNTNNNDPKFSDFFETLFRARTRTTGGTQQNQRRPSGSSYSSSNSNTQSKDTRIKCVVSLESVYGGNTIRITWNRRKLDVKVPQGIRPGQVIRLAQQGEHGKDLLLEIAYQIHPLFEVDGSNIIYTLKLMPWQAALGCQVKIPTLGGDVELKIPPDSDTGKKLKLTGRGLPNLPAGDQIVQIQVVAPPALTANQRRAYQQFAAAFGESIQSN